ncbi:MAG: dolichyl-phosphate beta-glucosyltransferase [Candidatus Omnitrophota bacterium]
MSKEVFSVNEFNMNEQIDISIVIPAYNEAKRLPLFLKRVISYCGESKNTYEVIVVDDASIDKTAEAVLSYKNRFLRLSLIQIKENQGKGNAVKTGLLQSNGKVSVFLDADGSVGPEEIEKNLHYISKEGFDIFAGSRELLGAAQVLKVKWYRKLIGVIFNFFVHSLLFKDIQDTQCGFKMFRKEVIEPLFSMSHLKGFGFDVEILYSAHKMGYRVKEGAVSWHHVGGSKVNLFADSIKMFFNILQIRAWYSKKGI